MFGVDFVDIFSSPVFIDYIIPFNIYCKDDLVVLNSLNFCLSEKIFISTSILKEIFAGTVILVVLSVLAGLSNLSVL